MVAFDSLLTGSRWGTIFQIVLDNWHLPATFLAVMWAIQVLASIVGQGRITQFGIYSWVFSRIWGIFTAPFIHANWAHLLSNSAPFLIFGSIICAQGNPALVGELAGYPYLTEISRFSLVTLASLLTSGLGTFVIGRRGSLTVGASGIIFGYFGYILTMAWRLADPAQISIALVIGLAWGIGMLKGIVPRLGSRVSWQGHLFGLVGGVGLAILVTPQV